MSGSSRNQTSFKVEDIENIRLIRQLTNAPVIVGDFNIYNTIWGLTKLTKETKLKKLLDHENIVLINNGE